MQNALYSRWSWRRCVCVGVMVISVRIGWFGELRDRRWNVGLLSMNGVQGSFLSRCAIWPKSCRRRIALQAERVGTSRFSSILQISMTLELSSVTEVARSKKYTEQGNRKNQTNKQTNKQTREMEQRNKQANKETNKQTNKQTNNQTNNQTNKQTNKRSLVG